MRIYCKATIYASKELEKSLSGEELDEAISNFCTDVQIDIDNMHDEGRYSYTSDVDDTTRAKMMEENDFLLEMLEKLTGKDEDMPLPSDRMDGVCGETLADDFVVQSSAPSDWKPEAMQDILRQAFKSGEPKIIAFAVRTLEKATTKSSEEFGEMVRKARREAGFRGGEIDFKRGTAAGTSR